MEIKDPRAVKFVLLHPFIALILSHHSAAETSAIGEAVSDAINVFYGHMGKTYEDAKKEQDMLIDYIIKMAEFNHIPIVKDKLREQLKQGIPKAFKIVDKLLPDNSKEHAKLLRDALDYDVKDPLVLLKQAGIDIEPELEEFRQFLAEISGKKAQKPRPSKVPKETSPDFSKEAAELLGIISGLKLAGADEKALRNLEEKLWGEVKAHRGNLSLAGLYAVVISYLREGDLDGAEEFLRGF